MTIHFFFHNLRGSMSFKKFVRELLADQFEKYASNIVCVRISLVKSREEILSSVMITGSGGLHSITKANGDNPYISTRKSIDKLKRMLRKRKDRLKAHKLPIARIKSTSPIENWEEEEYEDYYWANM